MTVRSTYVAIKVQELLRVLLGPVNHEVKVELEGVNASEVLRNDDQQIAYQLRLERTLITR
jgi:hypothetical protein